MRDSDLPGAALPRGFRDLGRSSIAQRRFLVQTIENLYRLHGFPPLETPAIEYASALGAHLPDGVFALRSQEKEPLALRYDLTAPLARYIAENRKTLTFPFRRRATGPVWRNEKPGPGRYREFWQCDADIVGAPIGTADAELCALMAAVLEGVGIDRSQYRIRLSDRRILDGVLETAGIPLEESEPIFRAIDKLDRLGRKAVVSLLGKGREDRSGDFTPGAGLTEPQTDTVLAFLDASQNPQKTLQNLRDIVGGSQTGMQGIQDLERILSLLDSFPCGAETTRVDPSIVRGMAYYTGPVFEAVLRDSGGVFSSSVAGGGRYDGLVQKFAKQESLQAAGISIGVDRLAAILETTGTSRKIVSPGPVLVLDLGDPVTHQRTATDLRKAEIPVEVYAGTGGMRQQMRHADRISSPIAVIEGENERSKGTVSLKDLLLGAKLAEGIESSQEWKSHPSQIEVPRGKLLQSVRKIQMRHA